VIFHDVISPQHEEDMIGESYVNIYEANLILAYIRQEMKRGVPEQEIGVVAPYSMQVKLLQTKLVQAGMDDVEVGTVEYFQGREKHSIFITCVRTRRVGFLNNPKRLNVAISRAKQRCILVGAFSKLLTEDPVWKRVLTIAQDMNAITN